jgi:Holliday junction resolvasome RuvABC endonuclease subunit
MIETYSFAGIDYSMSCPSITVGSSEDFSKCHTFFYLDKKKMEGKHKHNIYGIMPFPYDHEMERFHNIAQWAMSIMTRFKVKEVCLEGYAMGAKGRIFNIAENTALLKHQLWLNHIKYHTPSPNSVKKFYTGKGNAGKDIMHDSFVSRTGVDLTVVLNHSSDSNPISDIVDSHAMLCYGIQHYFN